MESQPIDVALKDVILDRINGGSFGKENLKGYFRVSSQICNNTAHIQDEEEMEQSWSD